STLRVTAATEDGIVMALEHTSLPVYGVQFHPESIGAEWGRRIFENFARITRERARGPRAPRSIRAPSRPSRKAQERASPRYRIFWSKMDFLPHSWLCFREVFAAKRNAYWLDSSLVARGLSRFSFMGDGEGPLSHLLRFDVQSRTLRVTANEGTRTLQCGFFEYVKERLAEMEIRDGGLPFDFHGGYVGYVGYEMKKECGAQSPHDSSVPDAQMLFADRFLAFDHQDGHTYLVCVDTPENEARAHAWLAQMKAELTRLAQRAHEAPLFPSTPGRTRAAFTPAFRLRHARSAYLEKIEHCRRAISQGETYEVCLTNKLISSVQPDPLKLYEELRSRNPAPYSAYLKYANLQILSSSPERFLKVDAGRIAESKPIKGTRRRGKTAAEDAQLRRDLAQSEKDRSENLMIVDLVRNDLGRVCDIGSVRVPKLMDIEQYATVHQMVSTVSGKLREDCGAVDAFQAAFPGGSMTGAPKIRTMEIIDALEKEARGVYSGAIGYFSLSGTCDFNVVIRTIQVSESGLTIGVGGAIIAMSDTESEFEEILLKAEAPLESVRAAMESPVAWEHAHIFA
ncbi:MAG TPA: aminodeoxychorismate synthase component I, partial [Polyangiaceae bacterium]|nr:aminodeoxychorismate synthase component I [Polyangiaceae bacterium]